MAFTDGVVAIIITILVLDIKAPDLASGESVRSALAEIAPTFTAFVVSFLLVGMYWVWHRGVFSNVRYVDLNAVWLSVVFLLPLSLVPFAASTLGEYPRDASALHVYGTVLVVITIFRVFLDQYLNRHPHLLWDPPNKRTRQLSTLAAAAPMVVYAVAILVAGWSPIVSLVLYSAVPLLYFLFILFLRDDPSTRDDAQHLS